MSEPEKAAKTHHGVSHAARDFLNHQMINLSNGFVADAINVRALYVFTGDQRSVWMSGRLAHCFLHFVLEGNVALAPRVPSVSPNAHGVLPELIRARRLRHIKSLEVTGVEPCAG
jgi:hypothetical protein